MISLVANTAAQGTNSSATTSGINTTGASLLTAVVISYIGSAEPTLSDSKGNTWTPGTVRTGGGANVSRARLWYVSSPTVGSGHTFSASGSTSFPAIAVSAWSGVDTVSPADQENGGGASASATSLATGSITPAEDGELILAAWGFDQAGTPSFPSADLSFTVLDSLFNVAGQSFGIVHAYLIQGTAAAINPTLTWGSSSPASALIGSFKSAAGSPPPPPTSRLLNLRRSMMMN